MYDTSKHVWFNPSIEYIFNTEIYEYDIRDAGFSIIKQYKLLPDTEIARLERIEKGQPRHKAVGILERDNKELASNLSKRFGDVREIFIKYNGIDPDNDILSVKKDAIFMIGKVRRTVFGTIDFRVKNTYSSYVRFRNLNELELYYNEEKIDIKGIGDKTVDRHRLYMYEFLKKTIGMMETKNPSVKRYVMDFIMKYKNMELNEAFYLEFNSLSKDINPLYNFQNIITPMVGLITRRLNE